MNSLKKKYKYIKEGMKRRDKRKKISVLKITKYSLEHLSI